LADNAQGDEYSSVRVTCAKVSVLFGGDLLSAGLTSQDRQQEVTTEGDS
jgi:hypothetical protein